mgnify:FL=1
MPTPKAKELYSIVGFDFGINNLENATALEADSLGPYSYKYRIALREAVNVDLTLTGGVRRRDGYSLVSSGRVTSLWADSRMPFGLCVRNGYLCRVSEQGAFTQLTTVTNEQVCYAYVNGEVLWSDGVRCGRVKSDGAWNYWGIPVPPKPSVTVGSGDLTEGRYRIAVTCVTADGRESGCLGFVEVDVSNGQKIVVAGVPTSGRSDITSFYVYCSLPFGEQLYLSRKLDLGLGGCEIKAGDLKPGRELSTLFLAPPTGAAFIRVDYGRVFIAANNYVLFSEPLNYELFNVAYNTMAFDSPVTGIECTGDGWYVGTENGVYFVQGTDPMQFKVIRLDYAGVVPGTMIRLERKYVVDKGQVVTCWLGTNGVFYQGVSGGQVAPMAAGRFKAGQFSAGTTLTRQLRGSRSVVFTLWQDTSDSERGITQVVPPLAPYEFSVNATLEDATG